MLNSSTLKPQDKLLTEIEIGYKYDIEGTLFNYYYDYSYSPKNLLQINQKIRGRKVDLRGNNVITEFGEHTFSYEIRKDMNGYPYHVYFVQKNGENRIILKSWRGAFQKQLIELFPSYRIPKYIREEQKLGMPYIHSIIHLLRLEHCFNENQKVYKDNNSAPIKDIDKAVTYLKVDSLTPKYVCLKEYNLKDKILRQYSIDLEEPHKKNGWHFFYNNLGVLSKAQHFNFGNVDTIKTYHTTGALFEKYYQDNYEYVYATVKNLSGEEVLNSDGDGSIVIEEPFGKRPITKEFVNHKIKSVFYSIDGVPKYLNSEKPVEYKFFDKFFSKFENEFKPKLSDSLIYEDGLTLINCTVDKNGRIYNASIVASSNVNQDLEIIDWLSNYKAKIFNPAKLNNKPIVQEVLIPIRYETYYKHKYKTSFF